MTTMKGEESRGLKLGFWKLGFIDGGCTAEEAERGRQCGGGGAKELGFVRFCFKIRFVCKPKIFVIWFSL